MITTQITIQAASRARALCLKHRNNLPGYAEDLGIAESALYAVLTGAMNDDTSEDTADDPTDIFVGYLIGIIASRMDLAGSV